MLQYDDRKLVGLWFMAFNATFSNISCISWHSVLLLEEIGVPGENHRPVASHWHQKSDNMPLYLCQFILSSHIYLVKNIFKCWSVLFFICGFKHVVKCLKDSSTWIRCMIYQNLPNCVRRNICVISSYAYILCFFFIDLIHLPGFWLSLLYFQFAVINIWLPD